MMRKQVQPKLDHRVLRGIGRVIVTVAALLVIWLAMSFMLGSVAHSRAAAPESSTFGYLIS